MQSVLLLLGSVAIQASEELAYHSGNVRQLVWTENSDSDVRLPSPREPDLDEKAQYLRSSQGDDSRRQLSFWSSFMSK